MNYAGILAVALVNLCAAAAPFQNLGFDSANTNNPVEVFPEGWAWGQSKDLLPGWQTSGGFGAAGLIGVNASPPGNGYISLYSPNATSWPSEGSFSLAFIPFTGESHTVSQTGDIPVDARALHFLSFDLHVTLSLNGQAVPLVYVPRSIIRLGGQVIGEVNDVYADISSFAGQTVNLSFSTLPALSPMRVSGLDSITFIVPEPSVLTLLAVGTLLLQVWRRAGK